jgi:predicted neuraminidase
MNRNEYKCQENLFKKITKEYICEKNAPFQSCHASNVAALKDGSIFCVWFAGSKEGADDVSIWGARRQNQVWSKPRILAQQENLPHWNPVLFVRPDGGVLLFYKVGREISSWQTLLMVSNDNGQSWSQPWEMVAGDRGGRGPVRNKVIALLSGRWLAPASLENGEWRCFADYSDDNGATWQKSNEIFADLHSEKSINPDFKNIPVSEQSYSGRGVIQPTLWESKPGQVHMLMRSSEGLIFRSDSADNGTSWCKGYATQLPNNNSGIDLVRVPDGRLFLVSNPVGTNWGPRTPITLSCSEDNGITWQDVLALEDEPGEYSYPSIIFSEGSLFLTYTYRREDIAFWKLDLI